MANIKVSVDISTCIHPSKASPMQKQAALRATLVGYVISGDWEGYVGMPTLYPAEWAFCRGIDK
jgi:hypothetical protein